MSSSSQRQSSSYSRRVPFNDDTNKKSSFRNQPNQNVPPLNRGRGYNEHQARGGDAVPSRGDPRHTDNRNDGYNGRGNDVRADNNKREQPRHFGRGNRDSPQYQPSQSQRHDPKKHTGREEQGPNGSNRYDSERNRNDHRSDIRANHGNRDNMAGYDPRRNDSRTGNNSSYYNKNRANDTPIEKRGMKRPNQEHGGGPFKQQKNSEEYIPRPQRQQTQQQQQQQFTSRKPYNNKPHQKNGFNRRPDSKHSQPKFEKSRSSFQNRGRDNDSDQSGEAYTPSFKRSDDATFSGQRKFEPQSTLARARTMSITQPKLINEILKEINRLQTHVQELQSVQPIEEVKVIDSKWNRIPEGFENLSAARAKLSGLFPLPGYPRPIDFTKLEGAIKNRLNNSDDILNETSRIDPIDSKVARTLIIKNDLSQINYLKLVEFFNDYLKAIDFEKGSATNIQKHRKAADNKYAIIEFNNAECATIIYSLNETELLFNAYKEEKAPERQKEKFKLLIARPGEYVVQDLEPAKSDEIEEVVRDSSRKISLTIAPNSRPNKVIEALEKNVAELQGIQFLRQKGTKELLGLVFVEFKDTPMDVIGKLRRMPFITRAFHSCVLPDKTPIQHGPVDFHSLKNLVGNKNVTPHPLLRVIRLLNAVSESELTDNATYSFIKNDMYNEASKYGEVVSIRIPRPPRSHTPGILQFNTSTGLGTIYIEFKDERTALAAMMELAGKLYNDRTVLATFYDFDDFLTLI